MSQCVIYPMPFSISVTVPVLDFFLISLVSPIWFVDGVTHRLYKQPRGGGMKSRAKVKEAMGFALDHADASADVVGVLKESLLVPETPIHGVLICGMEEGEDIIVWSGASFFRGIV